MVTVRSYLLFNLLKLEDLTWLEAPVESWSSFPSFIRARDFIDQLQVVNDGAERGIKLMQELIDRTHDETELQHLAQCVSHHRKLIGHTKKDYKKLQSIWFSVNFQLSILCWRESDSLVFTYSKIYLKNSIHHFFE